MPVDDENDPELSAFLSAVGSENPNSRVDRRSRFAIQSPFREFIVANWMSLLLLVQSAIIVVLLALLLATQSRIVFMLYALFLMLRWVNYALVVSALFHDRTKWLAVISGVIYTLCSFSGRLLMATG